MINEKIKRCILEGNEKFQKRKWAYFLPNVRGKVVFKPIFIFFKYSFGALANSHFCSKKIIIFLKSLRICIPIVDGLDYIFSTVCANSVTLMWISKKRN
jgi:hypothetical protein